MKHKVIIKLSYKGYIEEIHASKDTKIIIDSYQSIAKIEPDSVFQDGEGHKLFKGKKADKVKEWGI
jgi:hypothetical protein